MVVISGEGEHFCSGGDLHRLPYRLAWERVTTGNPTSAQRLDALGLVNEVTESGDALGAATARAESP